MTSINFLTIPTDVQFLISSYLSSNQDLKSLSNLSQASRNFNTVVYRIVNAVWERISHRASSKEEPCLSRAIVYKIDRLAKEKGWNALGCLAYLARCFLPHDPNILMLNPKSLESKILSLHAKALEEIGLMHPIDKADSCDDLDFSHSSQISVVPLEIQKFVNITGLNLKKMGLQYVPDEVCKLICLDSLSLENNPIHYLPESIGELKRLEIMVLSNADLSSLPESLGKLPELHTLILDHNRFSSLPPAVLTLEKLVKLDLNNNRITSLQEDLVSLKELKELKLYGNWLDCEHISDETLLGLPQLENLDLSDNSLTHVPLAITGLKNLTHLRITLNPLLWISKEILGLDTKAIENEPHIQKYKQELLSLKEQQGQPCSSLLGKLYQAILRPDNNADIQALFNTLSEKDRNLIMKLAPISPEDNFDNWNIEPRATLLTKVIVEKYHILIQKLRNDRSWVDNQRSKLNEVFPELKEFKFNPNKMPLNDLLRIADCLEKLGDTLYEAPAESPLKKQKT